MAPALLRLADALAELAGALEQGPADRVLAVEPRLAAAVADARGEAHAVAAMRVDVRRSVAALIGERLELCRRLGGTVPAVLSVMFPGQMTYAPGAASARRTPPTSLVTRVV